MFLSLHIAFLTNVASARVLTEGVIIDQGVCWNPVYRNDPLLRMFTNVLSKVGIVKEF